jgi:hypothetical protein
MDVYRSSSDPVLLHFFVSDGGDPYVSHIRINQFNGLIDEGRLTNSQLEMAAFNGQ